MGIGVSLFLFAVGAVLTWAIEVEARGIDLNLVGVILMIIGAIGFVVSMLFWSPWAPYGRRDAPPPTHDPHGSDHVH